MSDTIRVNVVEDTPVSVNVSDAVNYNNVTNKPSINGIELVGNKTTEELNINTWELIYNVSLQEIFAKDFIISQDNSGNSFSLKRFLLYITDVSREDEATTADTGRIYVNDTWFLGGSLYTQPAYVSKLEATYIGLAPYTWKIDNNISTGTGNTSTQRNQRVANNASQLGLATKFEIITNQKIKCNIYLLGVRS